METRKIRTIYALGDRPEGLSFSLPSKTHQSFEAEANINNLVGRYLRTGSFYDRPGTRVPQWGDFSELGDFRDVQERIVAAQTLFSELPAEERLRHGNDAGQFLAWLADPENAAEAAEMGLIERPEAEPKPEPKTPERSEPAPQGDAFFEPQNLSAEPSSDSSDQSST